MNKKGLGKIVVLAIVIIAIIAMVVVVSMNKRTIPPPPPEPEVEINSETGWKIYENEEYGFKVEYPPYGFLTADHHRFSQDSEFYTVEIRIPSPESFLIDINPARGRTLEEYSKSAIAVSEKGGDTAVNDILVDGIPAKKIITMSGNGNEYRYVLFVKEDVGYYISMIGPTFEDAEKMLTTFEFTR